MLYGILHCLICAAFICFHIKDHKIGSVNYVPVSNLEGHLKMFSRRILTDFNLIIVRIAGFLIVPKKGSGIWHNPNMGTVFISIFSLTSPDRRRNELIKVTISAYQKFHIAMLSQKTDNKLIQFSIQSQLVINSPMTKETHSIYVHDLQPSLKIKLAYVFLL